MREQKMLVRERIIYKQYIRKTLTDLRPGWVSFITVYPVDNVKGTEASVGRNVVKKLSEAGFSTKAGHVIRKCPDGTWRRYYFIEAQNNLGGTR